MFERKALLWSYAYQLQCGCRKDTCQRAIGAATAWTGTRDRINVSGWRRHISRAFRRASDENRILHRTYTGWDCSFPARSRQPAATGGGGESGRRLKIIYADGAGVPRRNASSLGALRRMTGTGVTGNGGAGWVNCWLGTPGGRSGAVSRSLAVNDWPEYGCFSDGLSPSAFHAK